jgi:N-acetylmuramoyl-L-alanine amidase
MRPAALFVALATAFLCAADGADLQSLRIGGIDYVSLEDGASRIGLRLERSVSEATVLLKSGSQPVARLTDHSREIDLKGLRVFLGDPVATHGGAFYVSRTDYQVRLLPRLRPDLSGPPPRSPHVIAIDPGHGGVDHGAENKALGSMEKTYTLDVSLRLKKLLEGAGYAVVLTRDSDYDLPKPLRSEIANRAGADLFISVHFNSLYPNTKTTGAEVLSFPPESQRSTDSWSAGRKTDALMEDAPVNRFDAWNTLLGGMLHRRLIEALHAGDRGEKFEHLGVLHLLKCPGVLVEPAFISSNVEGAELATAEFRDRIAGALFAGVQDYAGQIRALQPPAVKAPDGAAPATALPRRPAAGP